MEKIIISNGGSDIQLSSVGSFLDITLTTLDDREVSATLMPNTAKELAWALLEWSDVTDELTPYG